VEAEPFEQRRDGDADVQILGAVVDGHSHGFVTTPASGLEGDAVSISSMIPAR
jgi:hypothetical protein